MKFKKSLIGTYYKDKEKALQEVRRKNKLYGRDKFLCLASPKGFLVVSKKQIEPGFILKKRTLNYEKRRNIVSIQGFH